MLPPVIYVQCALWEQAARGEQKRLWVASKIVNESAAKLFLWRLKFAMYEPEWCDVSLETA